MLPEVAWAICADGGEERPSDKVYVDLDLMVPLFAIVCKSSEEAFAIIAAELERHGLRAERVKISPDQPEPELPPDRKTGGIGDILARMDRRAAERKLKTIKRDDNSRRRVSKEERKRAS